jgi:transcriptional regulator GlxA family with amidase domain
MTPSVETAQGQPPIPARTPVKGALSVAFILAPHFTLLAFSAFVDTLRLAADEGDRSRPIHCSWSVLSHNMRPVRSSCGVEVVPTAELDDPRRHDYVVVVGGLLDGPVLPDALLDYLRRAAAHQVPMVGVCTGSFVLARLGLLQERRVCVSWFHHAEFHARFPHLLASSDELFIIDEDRLTCAGGTSVVHLASHLVARHGGAARAAKALRIMIEEAPLPPMAPQPQPLLTEKTDEARVRRAMLLLERNLGNPLSPEFVARHVGLGTRQLERLFKAELGTSPAGFALQLRLANAHRLLLGSRVPIGDIALECGFVNRSHFARSVRAAYNKTPSQLRQAAAGRPTALKMASIAPPSTTSPE